MSEATPAASVVVERRIAAPPETVFSFLTTSERWALWQGREAAIDARPGGAFSMLAPNGMTARGEVVEVIPNRKLTFTWGWEGHPIVPPGSSTVSIELAAVDNGTLLTLTHEGLAASEFELHTAGWDHYATRLTDLAEGREVGADRGVSGSEQP